MEDFGIVIVILLAVLGLIGWWMMLDEAIRWWRRR